jgi:hypothetical protein
MAKAARFIKALFISSLLLLSFGCSEPQKKLPYAIDIDENHAGRIKADTLYDASQIATLMPGFDVKPFTSFIAGEPTSVLHVSYHDQPVLTISPTSEGNRIASVTVHSPEITAQRRVSIGEAFHTIFRCTDPCTTDKERAPTRLTCQAPGSRTIFYLFSTNTAEIKPQDNNITEHSWPVEAIIWKPDA